MMKLKGIRTAKLGKEPWSSLPELILEDHYEITENTFVINSHKTFQTILGFGGAVTESSAYVINQMLPEQKEEVLKAYYSSEGLNYNLGRLHIASCDFSLANYEYLTKADLKEFDMSHEDLWVIPLLQEIEKTKKKKIKYLASPWSPPAFMKTNQERNFGGKLKKEYYDLYAQYLIEYLKGMKERGFNIWGLSVQNEPAATQTWDSCIYEAEDERDFVKQSLGPALQKYDEDIKLLVWDHNRGDVLISRAMKIFSDQEASKYLWGIGNHWYVSEDYESLSKFHDLYPDKGILFTEGCVEYSIYGKEPLWKNGEHYARNMINDFNNYSRGFIDWNIVLDQFGGPNHVKNNCEAPIMYDIENKTIKYNISYYYIGHFSKFIAENAKRIQTIKSNNNDDLHCASFINPNGQMVVIVLNQGWIKDVTLVINGKGKTVSLPNNSITTYIIEEEK